MNFVDRFFLWIRSSPFLYRFTLFTRILLAAAFLPTGMVKLLGHRFTLIGPEHPIGAFFEAMYQTGVLRWRLCSLVWPQDCVRWDGFFGFGRTSDFSQRRADGLK